VCPLRLRHSLLYPLRHANECYYLLQRLLLSDRAVVELDMGLTYLNAYVPVKFEPELLGFNRLGKLA